MNEDFVIKDNVLIKYNGTNKIVKIPENIKIIKSDCFKNAKIKEVILPETVSTIGKHAFFKCKNLEKINLENVEFIMDRCFYECKKLKKVNFSKAKLLNLNAFHGCESLIELSIPKTIVDMGDCLIGCKNLKRIIIEREITPYEIEHITGFDNYNLIEITAPNIICENGVVYNKDKSTLLLYLEGKKDSCFIVPEKIKEIKSNAFSGNTNIRKIIFNDNIEKIHANICYGVGFLNEIELSKNIKIIDPKAFDSLLTISFRGTKSELEENEAIKKYINANSNNVKKLIALKMTLDELLEEGKSFKEANDIFKNQER